MRLQTTEPSQAASQGHQSIIVVAHLIAQGVSQFQVQKRSFAQTLVQLSGNVLGRAQFPDGDRIQLNAPAIVRLKTGAHRSAVGADIVAAIADDNVGLHACQAASIVVGKSVELNQGVLGSAACQRFGHGLKVAVSRMRQITPGIALFMRCSKLATGHGIQCQRRDFALLQQRQTECARVSVGARVGHLHNRGIGMFGGKQKQAAALLVP